MAKRIELNPDKTYATLSNLQRAVNGFPFLDKHSYVVCSNASGRLFPVFTDVLRSETPVIWAIQAGFCVVG